MAFLLMISLHSFSQPYQPVNKNASPGARKLLSYLNHISGKYILSGQHNYNHGMNTFSDSAKAFTGKYPAVWGNQFYLERDKG